MLGGLVDEVKDLQELGVKENFFKNALNEEVQVDSLLAYNRDRVANFERERFDWLNRYEMIKPKPQDEHRTEWETRQTRENLALLQKDLSDNRMRLFEERQVILKLQNENNQLKKKHGLDQEVMNTLVNYCNPIEQTVIYSKGKKPSRLYLTRHPNKVCEQRFEPGLQPSRAAKGGLSFKE